MSIGSSDDALAQFHQAIAREILTLPDLTGDPEWDTFAMVADVADDSVRTTAYRYTESGPPVSTPSPENTFLFVDLRNRTRGTNGEAWDVAIVKIHRDTVQLVVNLVRGDGAALWRVTPDNIARLPELLRPRPEDFQPL